MCESFTLGNKKFLLKSWFVYNKGEFRFFFTVLILIVPSTLFIILESKKDFSSGTQVAIIVSIVIFQILSLYYFLMSTFIDPGVVPLPLQSQERTETNLKIIEYQGRTFVLKFCQQCLVFRPLRAHHCRLCDVCVEELDHHCPWISNCVGRRNRRMFVALCFFASCLSIEILTLSILKLYMLLNKSPLDNFRIAFLIAFIVISSILGLSVLALFLLQFFLIMNGLTTNEYLRGAFQSTDNPYDKGCFKNLKEFFSYDAAKKNVNFSYLTNKKKFDEDSIKNTRNGESLGKKTDFSLEMNVMQTIESFKNDLGGELNSNNASMNMNKKLINEENNAL